MKNSKKRLSYAFIALALGSFAASAQTKPQLEGHRGLDYSFDLGPEFSLQKGGGVSFLANVGVGKKFNKNFYTGIAGGIGVGGGNISIPIVAKFRTYLPITNAKVIPYIGINGGYMLGVQDDGLDSNAPIVQANTGVVIPISPSIDLNPGLCYTAGFFKGQTSHSIGVRVGMDFHRSTAYKKKPWKPTRKKGLQYSIELGTRTPWNIEDGNGLVNLNVLAMYKWDDNLSFGVGVGYGDGSHPYKDEEEPCDVESPFYNLFLRGKYRLSESKVAPFASLDLGTHLLTEPNKEIGKSYILFATPAVGISFKVAGNSYLDVKAGYELGTAPVKTDDRYKGKTPGLTIGLTFTHTMDILTK